MFIPALMAIASVSYAAPTDSDVYEAFIATILEPVRYSGNVLAEPVIRQRPEFPAEVVIEKCVSRIDREVRLDDGFAARYDGYDCAFEVFPNGEPSFRNIGFLRFDGFDWVYHGSVRSANASFRILRERNNNNNGQIILKPGALEYDGLPDNPFNDDYDPYEDLLDLSQSQRRSKF